MMKSPKDIESGLALASSKGNQTAAQYLEKLQSCDCDEEKQIVIEDMYDDALRFHGFMVDFTKWLERKYLPNERQTWNLK